MVIDYNLLDIWLRGPSVSHEPTGDVCWVCEIELPKANPDKVNYCGPSCERMDTTDDFND